MASLNKVLLIGNLTRDPEVKYLPSGDAVADCRFALNERFKNKAGEWKERSVFVDVVVWGRQAETVGQYLSKGSPAFVEGSLQMDEWETPQGEKRSKMRIRADRVQFLGAPGKSAEYGDAPAPRAASAGRPSRGPAPSADRPPASAEEPLPEADEDLGGENLPF